MIKGRGQTILIAEDDLSIRLLMENALDRVGYRTIGVSNGVAALEKVDKESIDLLLTDIGMPEMGGIRLAYEIRAVLPDLKIIFMSGHPESEFKEDISLEGSYWFIQKPISLMALFDQLGEIL